MRRIGSLIVCLALCAPLAGSAQDTVVKPFKGRYEMQWHSITVGYSELELTMNPGTGIYDYVSRSDARGIFRIVYSDTISQKSVIVVKDGHAQPQSYHADDGSKSTAKTVSLNFDWNGMRAKGVSEDKPVDLALQPDTQDGMSIQIEIMLDLMANRTIQRYWVADKDAVKEFLYTNEGHAQLKTALGELDTIVLAGKRPGSNRITRLWFAPSLGYVPVQAERTRDGKQEFAMQVKSLQRQ
jgi:Protein of unknown function (DUF3108)